MKNFFKPTVIKSIISIVLFIILPIISAWVFWIFGGASFGYYLIALILNPSAPLAVFLNANNIQTSSSSVFFVNVGLKLLTFIYAYLVASAILWIWNRIKNRKTTKTDSVSGTE